jgi:hypothetical protein
MTSKKIIVVLVGTLYSILCTPLFAQEEKWGMNNPYIDDKLFHMGFQVGVNFNSFLTDLAPANVSSPGFGFRVGFVGDLRLCKYLNLRFTPGLEFAYKTLTYNKAATGIDRTVDVGAIPITLPLYLKFSAERVSNFRPYVIAGGGVSFNVNKYDPQKDHVGLNVLDYFCEAGFGCDIYFRWFKLCPELTYRIGFGDQLNRKHKTTDHPEYVTALGDNRLINQAICLTFNFQN